MVTMPCRVLLAGALAVLSCAHAWAGGLYLSQIASPASVGTAGVANAVNNEGPDSWVSFSRNRATQKGQPCPP
jgi:hypothetical protein